MGGPVFNGSLRIAEFEKAIYQSGSEAVTATNAIEDFQVLPVRRFIELAICPTDRAPIIKAGRLNRAQGGGCHFEVRESACDFLDHSFKATHVNFFEVRVCTLDVETEASGKIFLIPNHDIDAMSNAAVDFLGSLVATDSFPQRGAVVQVVRD